MTIPLQTGTSTPAPAEADASLVPAQRPRRVSLAFKTLLWLMAMLIVAIATCGLIFLGVTRSITREARRTQVLQYATSLAALMNDHFQNGGESAQLKLARLHAADAPDIDFVAITDPSMRLLGEMHAREGNWELYRRRLIETPSRLATQTGQVLELTGPQDGACLVASVPVFTGNMNAPDPEDRGKLLGYLHVGASSSVAMARVRALEGSVGLTCLLVLAGAFPVALLMARHILVPIQEVARGAQALAKGQLAHRVRLSRADELGELVDAFNSMASTMEQQQEAIRRINAGLEATVQQRTAELERVNKRLQAEIAEKEDFLRAVSHDLNAPLRNISGMASMLMLKYRSALEQEAVQRLERIQKNVEVECELINELLELSRIKTRREKIERVDLQTLVQNVAEQFSSDLETRQIDLAIEASLPVMNAERARLRQVFQNLVDNAIKYMRQDEPRRIRIGWRRDDHEVVFQVADTGIGVSAEDLPYLFHVFRRAKSATTAKIPGKGVGLASVKSIIETYGGRIWAESQPGVGTTFFLALPLQHFPLLCGQEVST